MRHLISVFDLTSAEIERVFSIAEELKRQYRQGVGKPLLAGRVMALLFEKPSLRTRVSFESAMAQLGGGSLFLGPDVGWGKRESVRDFARVLGQYVDVVVCRAHSHQRIEELAAHCPCSVINGLTDLAHPCQALADLYTLREVHGSLEKKTLAYIGDANNVARSLAVACGKLGVAFTIASPTGYHFDKPFVGRLKQEIPNMVLVQTTDPIEAVRGADAVYTDVWASMGQEREQEKRASVFADYQVNSKLLEHAPPDACFMHCLPARRGLEVTDEVLDGPRSRVLQQAGNRLHVQKGLLAWLLAPATGKV
jgi:ornithine carbamoyltransferase